MVEMCIRDDPYFIIHKYIIINKLNKNTDHTIIGQIIEVNIIKEILTHVE
jgi:hypothetical protein